MTKEMKMVTQTGHPCGEDFLAKPFLAAHPEYAWQEPYLRDMKAGAIDRVSFRRNGGREKTVIREQEAIAVRPAQTQSRYPAKITFSWLSLASVFYFREMTNQ